MMLFISTLRLPDDHVVFLAYTVISFTFSSLFSNIYSKWKTAATVPLREEEAEAAGDLPEAMLLKHVLTTKARSRLGGVGMLFESLHSVWRCGPHGCGACYAWKKHDSGLLRSYMLPSKPTHTSASVGSVHPPV